MKENSNEIYKKTFGNRRWLEIFFQKNLKRFFPNYQKITKIEIKKQKPGLSRGEFLKYKISLIKEYEIQEKEIYLKKAKRREYRILKKIQKSKLLLPRPLYYFPESELILYQGIKGKILKELIKEKRLKPEMIKKIAEFLVNLHQIKIQNIKKYSQNQLKRKASGILLAFRRHYLPLFEKVKEIINKILFLRIKFLKEFPLSFAHNDFTPSNIVITEDQNIGVIDFDHAQLNDHLVDVGMFLAQINSCKFQANFSERKKLIWQNLFKEYYLKFAKLNPKKERPKINIYQAWEEIHNASIFIKGAKKDKKAAEKMITEAENLIKDIY